MWGIWSTSSGLFWGVQFYNGVTGGGVQFYNGSLGWGVQFYDGASGWGVQFYGFVEEVSYLDRGCVVGCYGKGEVPVMGRRSWSGRPIM